MNRKSTPANNLMRALGAIIFIAILAISATDNPSLERLMVPIVVILVIGMTIARLVFAQFSRGGDGSASTAGAGRKLATMLVMLGIIGVVAAFIFSASQNGGGGFRDLLNWAPLTGAVDALLQWGGLLIVGGLIAVVGAVVLIVVLRRSSELPGGSSTPWDPDKPS